MSIKTKNRNTNNLTVVRGDLFDYVADRVKLGNSGSSVIVPHVCNNIDLFDGGFAAAVSKYYPIVKENYHLLGKNVLRSNPGYVQYVKVLEDKIYGHSLIFANMIAQNSTISRTNPRPLNYRYLMTSMVDITNFINKKFKDQNVEIHMPKFGCGLAGGNWNFIQDLVQDIWFDQKIYVYQL